MKSTIMKMITMQSLNAGDDRLGKAYSSYKILTRRQTDLRFTTFHYYHSHDFFIMITCPCNLHPLISHFYIVKLGFTGVYKLF